MNSAVQDHDGKAAETIVGAGDESAAKAKCDANLIPEEVPKADLTPEANRRWDISDWLRIS